MSDYAEQQLVESKPSGSRKRRWIVVALMVATVAIVGGNWGFVSRAASIRMYEIPSGSMAPAIQPGDRVTAELGASKPDRHEFWIFEMPAKNGSPPRDAIKRVIGLPGETIAVENGKVIINGRPLDEPYLPLPMTYTMAPIKLSETHYFLMGDQRNASADSHLFGAVPAEKLRGRVLYRVWPLDRAGPLTK
jgi:signal peptidase I